MKWSHRLGEQERRAEMHWWSEWMGVMGLREVGALIRPCDYRALVQRMT